MGFDPHALKLLLAESTAAVVRDHEAPTAAALARVPLYLDLGFVTEAYEICEALGGEPLARCYLGHMDLSRRRRVDEHMAWFEALLASQDPLIVAHARLARGTRAAQMGETAVAFAELTEARALFTDPVQVGKADVCLVMVLRMEGRHDEALALAEAAIERLAPLGAVAASPLALLYAAAAGEHVRKNELYRARTLSWQAARIASVLTGAKSSGFVLFQHGRVEHGLGNFRAARRVLEKADRLQGVLDPLARVATRILIFECLRAEKMFVPALEAAETLLADPFLASYAADREEFVEEAVGLYLDLFDPEGAARFLGRVGELPRELKEKLEAAIAVEARAWGSEAVGTGRTDAAAGARRADAAAGARRADAVAGATSARLRIDGAAGRIAGRTATGAVIALELGRDPTSRHILSLLVEATARGETRTTLDDCVAACTAARDPRRGATDSASIRRGVRRAIQRLAASGAVRLHDLSDKSLVGFTDGLTVELRSTS